MNILLSLQQDRKTPALQAIIKTTPVEDYQLDFPLTRATQREPGSQFTIDRTIELCTAKLNFFTCNICEPHA